jgi:ATP-dependent Lon protease
MSVSLTHSRLPLIPLPSPLILLPSARLTFPISNNQADALIRLFNSSITNPLFAAVPFVQHDGTTTLHEWGVTARIARFVRPRAQSDEPYLLTLAGITRIHLTNTSTNTSPSANNTATGTSDASSQPHPLPRVTVIRSPPDAQSPPAPDIIQDFKAAAIRLLERFAQDSSQSARKRESWARIALVVDETESDKAAALADAIVSAVGAEHVDKLGECQRAFFLFHISSFIWVVCVRSMLVGGLHKRRGRRRSTYSAILSGICHAICPLPAPPSDRVPLPSLLRTKIVC